MQKKIMGFQEIPTTDNTKTEYDIHSYDGTDAYNPLSRDRIPQKSTKFSGAITSIPSPYARMHITDLAFQELNEGLGMFTNDQRAANNESLSRDYSKALSHCLDIFELLFRSNELELKENGIILQCVKLHSWKHRNTEVELQKLIQDPNNKDIPNNLGSYLQTLDVFRDEYLKNVDTSISKFDFQSLYIIKYCNRTIAAASPFTGFFAKADCNVVDNNGNCVFSSILNNGQSHELLTAHPTSWCGFDKRSNDFKEFMYMLLRDTGLCKMYKNMYVTIESDEYIRQNKAQLDNKKFNDIEIHKKFNIGVGSPLQCIQNEVFVRPDGLDCSYLKFMLYLESAVDLSIKLEEYDTKIDERQFPHESNNFVKWLGVNDILSDALFVSTYDINDNYVSIPYYDENDDKLKYRCLVPLKQSILKFLPLKQFVDTDALKIVKHTDGSYVVSVKLHLANGGVTILKKEYVTSNNVFPQGLVVENNAMRPFALGIYPFIKVDKVRNRYRILFYNVFKNSKLSFYHEDGSEYLNNNNEQVHNQTNSINDIIPYNCNYYGLNSEKALGYINMDVPEFGSSLIIPKLKTPNEVLGKTNISVDLGTSNTYIAFQHIDSVGSVGSIEEIDTKHNGWNELTFMQKTCLRSARADIDIKNEDDLYLDPNKNDECLNSQLCEFMPTQVGSGYKWPIPSVINFLRCQTQRIVEENAEFKPLVHSAIPFSYYERGIRVHSQKNFLDFISHGSNFKWFMTRDREGNTVSNQGLERSFDLYMQELLFIIRSNMLSKGYDIRKCCLLWSYPLAFDVTLKRKYESKWKSNFVDYFETNDDSSVKYTNESRTPIFKVDGNRATNQNLTVLVDMGGGSTDVIGYVANKPLFITSFGFAGNSLYLDGAKNANRNNPDANIFMNYVGKALESAKSRSYANMKLISKDDSISAIMNYGFTNLRNAFEEIFDSTKPKFMLMLHNAAIVYHLAQLCKIKSPDSIPSRILLTGNGSKQFQLNSKFNTMLKSAFAKMYNLETDNDDLRRMSITLCAEPKKAAAQGGLIGLSEGIATDGGSDADTVIMIGDADSILMGRDKINIENYQSNITENVDDFINWFYSLLKYDEISVEKEDMKYALKEVSKNVFGTAKEVECADSFFFKYVALLMDNISYKMLNNN